MSVVNIGGGGASFSYDMKTRDCGWSIHVEPITCIDCYDVIEIVPTSDDDFKFKVNMLLLLRKLDVI